jgi:hypothetical protein
MDDLVPISRPEDDIDNRENSELDTRFGLQIKRYKFVSPKEKNIIAQDNALGKK